MRLTKTKVILLTAILVLIVVAPVALHAQEIPHTFFGTAYVDGSAVSPGTTITAVVGDKRVSTTVNDNRQFFLLVPPEIDGVSSVGKTVTFRIGNLAATQSVSWASGGRNETNFRLTASASPTSTPRPTATRRPAATPRPTATPVPRVITGPRGPQGPQGPAGEQGPEGPQGPQGLRGPAGADGDAGATGADGEDGSAGERGPQGYIGQTGPQGVAGPSGLSGPQGPAGPAGSSGNFLIAIIALVVALLALLVAIGRWIWELQVG